VRDVVLLSLSLIFFFEFWLLGVVVCCRVSEEYVEGRGYGKEEGWG
jgi:hypothetical protein